MDPLTSPHLSRLQEAVAEAYEVFGRGRVSAGLEVCQCPVCMTEDTRQAIIATRNDALPVALICEYSNSAHGVPCNLSDLKLLLPRYLDLMAQDEMVDDIGVGTELCRFGDALRQHPDLYAPRERAVLDDWARAALMHFAWAEACDEPLTSPFHLFEVLICGGWDVDVVTGALEAAFEDPETGAITRGQFAGILTRNLIQHPPEMGVDWFALGYVGAQTRRRVAGWLNDCAARVSMDGAPLDYAEALDLFHRLAGHFNADHFPAHRT